MLSIGLDAASVVERFDRVGGLPFPDRWHVEPHRSTWLALGIDPMLSRR